MAFAAVFTLPLLFVGGSVTTYRVGLAVPDWPTTFGINMFLYDFWNAPFGVRSSIPTGSTARPWAWRRSG